MKWKDIMIITGMILGVYIGVKYILPVIIPFLLGWILALFSYTVSARLCAYHGIQKLRLGRQKLSVGIIFVAVGVLLLILWGVLHFCTESITVFAVNWKSWQSGMQGMIGDCCRNLEEMTGITAAKSSDFIYERIADCKNVAVSYLQSGAFLSGTVSSMKFVFVCISVGLISVISGILLVKDFEQYKAMILRYEIFCRFWKVLKEMGEGLRLYLKAQIKIMGAVGILCAAGLYFLGVKHFLILGLGIGLLDALPVLGTGMILVPWAVWAFLQNRLWQAGGLLVLFALTSILRQVLEPKWIGKDLGVQPLYVLAAIYLGVVVYGGTGFFLGPVSALLLWYLVREWKNS